MQVKKRDLDQKRDGQEIIRPTPGASACYQVEAHPGCVPRKAPPTKSVCRHTKLASNAGPSSLWPLCGLLTKKWQRETAALVTPFSADEAFKQRLRGLRNVPSFSETKGSLGPQRCLRSVRSVTPKLYFPCVHYIPPCFGMNTTAYTTQSQQVQSSGSRTPEDWC